MVTVLWRLENSPVTDYIIAFEDVPSNSWYADAVRWAASAGIVTGISDTNYAPDSYITREQLATMLCRYATYKGYSTTADATALQVFDDYENISPYAADALAWTVSTNLINGMGDNTLLPQGNATRAQTAAVLMRFVENISK